MVHIKIDYYEKCFYKKNCFFLFLNLLCVIQMTLFFLFYALKNAGRDYEHQRRVLPKRWESDSNCVKSWFLFNTNSSGVVLSNLARFV